LGAMAADESFGEAEYTLRFPAAETAEHVRRELSEKGYEVEVASPAAGAWDVHVRWKGWRSARVARTEPDWMRRVAAHNGGSLAE
jgi:hypothetical protein